MDDGGTAAEHMETPSGDMQAVWEKSEGLGFLPPPHAGRSRAKEILLCFYYCDTVFIS